ncbi:MAG TPA: PAS-domain containing protein [Rhizomicrobium sp.]|nr:PAS-domain containing protein [Rhizomicrobium sp.]
MRPNSGQDGTPGIHRRRWQGFLLAAAPCALTPLPALAAVGDATPDLLTFQNGNIVVLSALACGGVALAIAAGLWALAEQRAARRLRRSLRLVGAKSKAAIGEREALLGAAREALVVWGKGGEGPFSYGGGEELLQSCLKGPDALALSGALDGLSDRGAAFALKVQDHHGRALTVRGRAVGSMAAVWLEESAAAEQGADYRAILDALPIPVWLRDKALALSWANHAFLKGAGAPDLDTARREQAALDKSERDLAAAARAENAPQEAKRFSVVGGQRRALSFTEIPLGDAGVIGTAVDVTDITAAEARLQQHADAHAATLDTLATAVAIFGGDQKLSFYNRAFAKLWGLPESWLDKHPSESEILDRLRDHRRLPEQRDYPAWKRTRLALYQEGRREQPSEDVWHLPGGQTIRVASQPHPFGGLTLLYEDVTARLNLESDYNTLMKVQSATLDTLSEGVAVFGTDGKLKLHNAAFARIWEMEAGDLDGEPHVRTIAALSEDKFGKSPIWDQLIQAIAAGIPAARDMGDVERSDRSILSLNLSPLPDGALLAAFTDVTDRFRIENALRDRNEGLEAADRLKSDFIKHVSYELRTPLNTILGFSEHLASGAPGSLNPQQEEYIQAILAGGNTLKSLVNDILDLALVESGALRLELERIDLFEIVTDVAAHAREWASKVGLTLEVDCAPDAGRFLADARRLRQIMFNLLSNAFKFTPRGGVILLSAKIVGEDVQIAVSDNGPGIPAEVKASVFERFSAKGQAGNRAGAGLGLALVNRFLELHDGWVEIESRNGTLVRCHLPRRIHDDEPHPEMSTDRKTAYL